MMDLPQKVMDILFEDADAYLEENGITYKSQDAGDYVNELALHYLEAKSMGVINPIGWAVEKLAEFIRNEREEPVNNSIGICGLHIVVAGPEMMDE